MSQTSDSATTRLCPTKFTRYQLPGFGLPLNFTPYDAYTEYQYNIDTREKKSIQHPALGDFGSLFPNTLDGQRARLRLTPLRDFTMMRLMNQLTDKADWETKIFDDMIVARWKAEALSAPNVDITESMVSWCIDELRYKSERFKVTRMITAFDGDVVKSDAIIPYSLQSALKAAVAPLENVSEAHRDWHPGSDGTVLDLVHPSLFPVVYGRTKILGNSILGLDDYVDKSGGGDTLRVPPINETRLIKLHDPEKRGWDWEEIKVPYSRKFQWLPCEVEFTGDKVKIASYINNLHPKEHKPLYEVIERVIELTIPLWNQTLTPLKLPGSNPARIEYSYCEYEEVDVPMPEPLSRETTPEFYQRLDQWEELPRRIIKPEPAQFTPPSVGEADDGRVNLIQDYAERGLQIIVKLANVHLTPEKPTYGGGTWHVEGQLNEHICATALYYYDCANITESRLSFRQQTTDNTRTAIIYDQGFHQWLPEIFGCQQYGSTVQYVGDVVTKEGRLLTFPNVFQHRVQPFQLLDTSKPGHRKILALFLVDPHIRIISSANVPPQQREWWAQEFLGHGLFERLPVEIHTEIIRHVEDFPICMGEAKELRLELMDERKAFVKKHDEQFMSETFSLCEH